MRLIPIMLTAINADNGDNDDDKDDDDQHKVVDDGGGENHQDDDDDDDDDDDHRNTHPSVGVHAVVKPEMRVIPSNWGPLCEGWDGFFIRTLSVLHQWPDAMSHYFVSCLIGMQGVII
jgi:hypothetical protein